MQKETPPQIMIVLLRKDGDLQLGSQYSLLCECLLNGVILFWVHLCFSSVFPANLESLNFGQNTDINFVHLACFFF